MTLYLMGETSINSSPITTKQKNRLYNLLSELREDMCLDDIYCFYEENVIISKRCLGQKFLERICKGRRSFIMVKNISMVIILFL